MSSDVAEEGEKLEGKINTEKFKTLRNKQIEGELNVNGNLSTLIENTDLEGDFTHKGPAKIIESDIRGGDIEGYHVLRGAEKTTTNATNIRFENALPNSSDSLLMGDNLNLIDSEEYIGIASTGSVIAAKNLEEKTPRSVSQLLQRVKPGRFNHIETVEPVFITSEEAEIDDAIKFEGEWDNLSEYLEEEVPEGTFRPFELFDLPDTIEDINDFRAIVEDAQSKYDEVKEKANDLDRAKEYLELEPLEGEVKELYDRIKETEFSQDEIDDFILEAVSEPESEDVKYTLEQSRYHGNNLKRFGESLEELTDILNSERLDENFIQGLQLVGLDDQIENAEELEYQAKALEMIGSEIKEELEYIREHRHKLGIELSDDGREAYNTLREVKDTFDMEVADENGDLLKYLDGKMEGSIDEKYERLANIQQELKQEKKDKWNLSDDAMKALNEGDTEYLLKSLSKTYDQNKITTLFKSILGRSEANKLLEEYRDGNSEKVLEPEFSNTKFLDGDNAIESREEAVNTAYSEGLELINRLSRDQGTFSVEHPEIEELEEELNQTIEEISNSQGRPSEELIQRKNELKSMIPEKKREIAFEEIGLNYREEQEYSNMDPVELRQVLDQLGQEYLEEDENNPATVAGKASELAGRINMSKDVGNGYVEFEVYDKDITDLPSTDRRVPCTFPGGGSEGEFFNYMKDPGTQIALLESGDDEGAVISHPAKYNSEDYLLVHSVESDDGITSRNDVSKAIREQIEEYADEADMEGVIYSTSAHNTAANDFIEAALQQDLEYHEEPYKLDKKGRDDVHLDFNLPEIQGYKVEL